MHYGKHDCAYLRKEDDLFVLRWNDHERSWPSKPPLADANSALHEWGFGPIQGWFGVPLEWRQDPNEDSMMAVPASTDHQY